MGKGEHGNRERYVGNSRLVVFTQRVPLALPFPLTLTWTVLGADQTPLLNFTF